MFRSKICICLVCALFVFSHPVFALPNILIIITDDQRYDDLDLFMPFTKSEIFDKGVRFSNAYVTTPACCPSRSSILTGLYVSEHGVSGNRYVLDKETFVERLKKDDLYYTGLVGKYLNSWSGETRPEYNYWVSVAGGSVRYNNPILNYNGEWSRKQGYATDLFRNYALEFLEKAKTQEKPFLLLLNFNAPHYSATPALEDQKKFLNVANNTAPSFLEADRTDKPLWVQARPTFSTARIKTEQAFRLRQRQCLASVDRAIQLIVTRLRDTELLNETVIFFLSDNGVLNGEHHLASKDVAYEEAIKIPFAIRYPKVFPPQIRTELVANIDIAPTVLDIARTSIPEQMSGRSLFEVVSSPGTQFREDLLIEGFRGGKSRTPFAAVHTSKAVLIKNAQRRRFDPNRYELYDLRVDPFQMENAIHWKSAGIKKLKEQLRRKLKTLLLKHRGTTKFRRPKGVKLHRRPKPPIKKYRLSPQKL